MGPLILGARQLPMAHISIRVPWHDAAWDGTVCRDPANNTCCRVLKNIVKNKNDQREDAVKGQSLDALDQSGWPPCLAESSAFMSPKRIVRLATHPYSYKDTHRHFVETPFVHPPYSASCIPFRWVLREKAIGPAKDGGAPLIEAYRLGYVPDREPELGFRPDWVEDASNQRVLLDTFFSAIQPQASLCFFYAKKTPLSEDRRRVLIGVGRVLSVGDVEEYRYAVPNPPIRCVLWERSVVHSVRPAFKDGFLLPYHEILAAAQEDSSICPDEFLAFVPEEHFTEFQYGSEHVSHDGAIASLLACAAAIKRSRGIVPGPWDRVLRWIDGRLNELWTSRGAFPGLGSALSAFGLECGTLIAYQIGTLQERNSDPWPLVDIILRTPSALGDPALARTIGKGYAEVWKKLTSKRRDLLELLSRMTLSAEQATRWYQETERAGAGVDLDDKRILENPYVICEADSALDFVALETVDRGVFPDDIVAKKHPLPEPSAMSDAVDPRRVRAFVADTLGDAANEGHTLLLRDWVIDRVRDRELRPPLPLSGDVLAVAEGEFGSLIQVGSTGVGTSRQVTYQLSTYCETGKLIRATVERRAKGRRHDKTSYNWRKRVDGELKQFDAASDPDEDVARSEKATVLEEIYRSRISVLIGSAGTGKTTLVKMLCDLPDVDQGGVLLLAPTGKARVRLESKTNRRSQGKTIASFLLCLERFDGETGRYFINDGAEKCSEYKTVVVDECSMLTEEQLAAVLDALAGVDRLVLVGDPHQLPPIGAGRPFMDIVRRLAPADVESRFPRVGPAFGELTVARRQNGKQRDDLTLARWFSGRPVDAGADEIWGRISAKRSEFLRIVEWSTPEDLQDKLIAVLVEELKLADADDENGFERSLGGELFNDAVYFYRANENHTGAASMAEDWQILSPVRVGLHGVDSLNRTIQQRFRKRVIRWSGVRSRSARRVPPPSDRRGSSTGTRSSTP